MQFNFLSKIIVVIISLLIIIPLFAKIKAVNSQSHKIDPQKFQELVDQNTKDTDTTFGIVVWDLNNDQKYFLNEEDPFETASLYKLSVMYTLFYLESKGKLDTNQSDIKENIDLMITLSSNESAIYLVEKYTSWDQMSKLMKEKGLEETSFSEDNLVTTPKDMATLLKLINNPEDISPEAKDRMMEFLLNQKINDRIPALLPDEVEVAHKTGDFGDVVHDAGIINAPGDINYILVIMTKNSKMPEGIKPIMAKISLDIFNLFDKNN